MDKTVTWVWPDIAICIVTYDRLREIKQTVSALRTHFLYSGPIHWHLADDASPAGYIDAIKSEFSDIQFTVTTTQREGWGANVNKAMGHLGKYPYIFLIEDDYVAQKKLNINAGVALMEAKDNIAVVRYDGVAAHTFDLRLREAKTHVGNLSYMLIEKSSPHLNVYSNRPHLRHFKRFAQYGRYPEGKPLGVTEEEFAHRIKDDATGQGEVAILADGIVTAFDHIGRSWQGSERDKETVKRKR